MQSFLFLVPFSIVSLGIWILSLLVYFLVNEFLSPSLLFYSRSLLNPREEILNLCRLQFSQIISAIVVLLQFSKKCRRYVT